MIKLIAAIAGITAVLAPAPKELPKPKKPPQSGGGTVIVRVLDGQYKEIINAGGEPRQDNSIGFNDTFTPYELEPQEDMQNADAKYNEMKASLDSKYARMFELKRELDETSSTINTKWEEYNALNRSYQRSLKKLIAAWVTESMYS